MSSKNKGDLKVIFDAIFSKKEIKDFSLIKKYVFLLEACEYQRHFLSLDLDDAILTSLECDHLDYYKDKDDYLSAFVELVRKLKHKIFLLEGAKEQLEAFVTKNSDQGIEDKFVLSPLADISFDHLFGDWNTWNASLLLQLFSQLFSLDQKLLLDQFRKFR
ncbi:MAG: hypothetical protein GXP45_00635 [bacterium]|nr:hypothetical protein [bacterium]